jgi:serine/threonine protein kinase/Tol biopolymer transport system component
MTHTTDPLETLRAALADRYTILQELGTGGMATVYLAEDIRHHRNVAIKVLHPELSAVLGPERFLKEIELTANLQHPHILPLFDSGSADGLLYYVMPYVEGETLRDRLNRDKQLSIGDAVRLAREAADALEYAHGRGIVHRDIKPENILLQSGHCLIADFGIALAVQQAGGTRMTQTGLSLGTPQYMSPEQAMGERDIGPRSDIYSLGAVTYEMLSGDPPFTGSTAQAIVAQVLTTEPRSLTAQRKSIPGYVDDAVATALEKLPADRFASAAAFAAALGTDSPARRSRHIVSMSRGSRARVVLAPTVLALVTGFVLGGAWLRHRDAAAAAQPVTHRSILDSDDSDTRSNFAKMAASPDGSIIVATDPADAQARLSVRHLDQLTRTPIPGTDAGASPFISWDSRTLGFVKSGGLYTLPIEGGVATRVPNAQTDGVGAPAWAPDGRIVFTDMRGALAVIRPDGTGLRRITSPDSNDIDVSPNVLPDGGGVLFAESRPASGSRASSVALAVPLSGGPPHVVSTDATAPQYDAGYVVYARGDGALSAIPFDQSSLSVAGPAQVLGDHLSQALGGVAHLTVGHGVIIYQRATKARLMSMDRSGVERPLLQEAAVYHRPSVSPDGRSIAFDLEGERDGQRDVWKLDIASATLSRLTNVGDGHDASWSSDGRQIIFLRNERPGGDLFTVPVDRSVAPRPFHFPPGFPVRLFEMPGNWLPGDRYYLGGTSSPTTLGDIWLLAADGSPAIPLANSAADEHSPAGSPDGRWFAYVSNESGRQEVYVQAMAASGARAQVSRDGGTSPVWSPDGHALYYLEPSGNMSNLIEVGLALNNDPRVISRQEVAPDEPFSRATNHANFAVMPDNRHFVVVVPDAGQGIVELTGWTTELRRAVPR